MNIQNEITMPTIKLTATGDEVIAALRRKVILDDAFFDLGFIPMTDNERDLLIRAELLCRKLSVNSRDYINSVIFENRHDTE